MVAQVQVKGLRELQAAFKSVDADIPKELRNTFKVIAQMVATAAAAKVPRRTGTAAASITPRATQRGAAIAFGGPKAPYYPWLDFGGTVGRGHKPNRPYSGSVKRQYMGRPFGSGRYIYPTIEAMDDQIKAAAAEAVIDAAKRAGFETH